MEGHARAVRQASSSRQAQMLAAIAAQANTAPLLAPRPRAPAPPARHRHRRRRAAHRSPSASAILAHLAQMEGRASAARRASSSRWQAQMLAAPVAQANTAPLLAPRPRAPALPVPRTPSLAAEARH